MTAQDCCNFPGCSSATLVCETVDIAGQPPMPGGCSVQFPESLAATIDLTAVPEKQPYAGKALADALSIQSIAYSISGNTLNDPFGSAQRAHQRRPEREGLPADRVPMRGRFAGLAESQRVVRGAMKSRISSQRR
jgi:hypothetical protein